ncbi:MAG: 2-oxoacid:acceptor oxidoreductase family protein, partial [Candidatus Omnitrophica bacterium]|nr:2-oxoacid:acceptor oxidoreductase family protein [Candidatus Omnitrophota bacterium]
MVDYVFRVGGEGGEGVISTGELLTLTLARIGFEIYTFRTYPAEIKGGHANFQVRAADKLLLSQGSHVDVFVAFNEEAYEKHIQDLKPGGVLVYDADSFTPPQAAGRIDYGIPLTSLATEKVGVKLTKNIVVLGALSALFDISFEEFEHLLRDRFARKGEAVVQKNLQALRVGADYAKQIERREKIRLGKGRRTAKELVLSGNESLALGAIAVGCRIYAGYPITPATDIMEFLAKELPK